MENNGAHRSPYILSSLDNALKIMDILSVKENLSLAELTRISKLDKTSVFKILFTLERRNYVSKSADARYCLGAKFTSQGDLASERKSLAELAMPYMHQLRNRCHETVYLGVLNTNGRVIVMHMEEGDSLNSISTRIGYELDAHCNAMGKVLLAWLTPAMQRSMIENLHFKVYTANTISSPEQLYPELKTIQSQGWGEDEGERYPGHGALAVPVFDTEMHCVASLSIVCRSDRLLQDKDHLLNLLLTTGENISYKL